MILFLELLIAFVTLDASPLIVVGPFVPATSKIDTQPLIVWVVDCGVFDDPRNSSEYEILSFSTVNRHGWYAF